MSDIQFANKGELLKLGREVPRVLKVSPTAHRLYYQCLIRCDAQGRIASFSACARAAGISSEKGMTRPLKALKEIGLVYTLPRGGGGINLEKLVALHQEVVTSYGDTPLQFTGGTPCNLQGPPPANCRGYKSLKKKKDARVTRNFSSWTDKGDDVVRRPTMNCSTEII